MERCHGVRCEALLACGGLQAARSAVCETQDLRLPRIDCRPLFRRYLDYRVPRFYNPPMASKSNSVKVAFDFDPKLKHRLAMLKADLRLRGIPATETGVLEVLVGEAKLEGLARAYRRYLDT